MIGRVHVGKHFQAEVPRVGRFHRGATPSVGEEVWRGTRPEVAGLAQWLAEVCAELRAAPGERGCVAEHCLQALHAWDYDLAGLRANWRRVCQLRPLPALGPARWSRDDTFALEQIQHCYPDRALQVSVACAALTAHSPAEVQERLFWLVGERSACRPLLFVEPEEEEEEEEEEVQKPQEAAAEQRPERPREKEQEHEDEDEDGDEQMPLAPPAVAPVTADVPVAAVEPASPAPPFHANLVGLSPAEKKRKLSSTLPLIFSRIQEHNRSL